MHARRLPLRRSDLLLGWDFVACGLALPIAALALDALGVQPAVDGRDLLAKLPFGMVIVALALGLVLPRIFDADRSLSAALRHGAYHVLPVGWVVLLSGRAEEAAPGLFLGGWLVLTLLFLLPRLVLQRLGRWPLS